MAPKKPLASIPFDLAPGEQLDLKDPRLSPEKRLELYQAVYGLPEDEARRVMAFDDGHYATDTFGTDGGD